MNIKAPPAWQHLTIPHSSFAFSSPPQSHRQLSPITSRVPVPVSLPPRPFSPIPEYRDCAHSSSLSQMLLPLGCTWTPIGTWLAILGLSPTKFLGARNPVLPISVPQSQALRRHTTGRSQIWVTLKRIFLFGLSYGTCWVHAFCLTCSQTTL